MLAHVSEEQLAYLPTYLLTYLLTYLPTPLRVYLTTSVCILEYVCAYVCMYVCTCIINLHRHHCCNPRSLCRHHPSNGAYSTTLSSAGPQPLSMQDRQLADRGPRGACNYCRRRGGISCVGSIGALEGGFLAELLKVGALPSLPRLGT